MAAKQFGISTLCFVENGQLALAWNNAVDRATRDCAQRPLEQRPRKVILQAEFVPSSEGEGEVDDVEASFQVKDNFPSFQTRTIVMKIRKRGQQLMLTFDDEPEEEDS